MKVDPRILRAERLRAIMNMPEYHDTLGAWIEEAYRSALHKLSSAVEVHDVHRAQGSYEQISSLRDMFEKVFREEEVAVEKQLKKTAKALR